MCKIRCTRKRKMAEQTVGRQKRKICTQLTTNNQHAQARLPTAPPFIRRLMYRKGSSSRQQAAGRKISTDYHQRGGDLQPEHPPLAHYLIQHVRPGALCAEIDSIKIRSPRACHRKTNRARAAVDIRRRRYSSPDRHNIIITYRYDIAGERKEAP